MKVAMINGGETPIPPPTDGGTERHIYEVSRALCAHGIDVDIFDFKHKTKKEAFRYFFCPRFRFTPVKYIPMSSPFLFSLSSHINMLKNSYRSDIIHCHFSVSSIYFSFFRKRNLVYTSHMPFWDTNVTIFDKLAVKRAAAVIALTREIAESMSGLNKNIFVIPNGVDINRYRPKQKNKTSNKLLFVGRVTPQKGLEYLINAMMLVKREIEDVELNIVGPVVDQFWRRDGRYYHLLLNLVKKFNLGSSVSFTGPVSEEEKIKYYQNSDLFILPSLREGLALVLLEAIACGLPVISTDVSGSKDIVTKNGIIVPKKDPKALAEAIIYVMRDKKKLKNMSRISRRRATDFSWDNVAKKLAAVYEFTLKQASQ